MCAGFWLFDHSMPLRASSAGSEMILVIVVGKDGVTGSYEL